MTKNEENNLQAMEIADEIYADGVLSVGIRQNIAKIDFYQAFPVADENNTNEQRELRKASRRIVLPVTGLIELHDILSNIMEKIKNNAEK
ncbi:hypothetical protein BTHERMOSOX_743 [Bathymodiolus thermophilus thioautotrophic gill symbiont]|uniref:Uncharacterized protein n=1 Tax=Bathymodiolus thermophilus thioautotrophic gill symbiont TaxID=2360 RepID=A0A1J5TX22_9GAMM|nr:hypothetical protein [Bathymodiolus thermophilus thioautotrophic gill symbiont]AYQ55940.1 hypothetical protein MS2017_0186 [Bathymodiolus thermophilus thioautotrophic gill symbiont]OIR24764.1 hypothetical protein BGC33_11710 [Bathymodiolus thermophilus thioautotrophic gill symbiont]CAB5494011.1 hypothetical protein THERMOT_43 [Bathymodiolus thermophilus thioautotrophic gill symbiont]CAB5498823.1 hypothetical protein THERMOS_913 [Bathymodiolus thermophilus thioautotrophic gill symbiont]SHA03